MRDCVCVRVLPLLSDDRARICVKACSTRFYSHRRYEHNNIATTNNNSNNNNKENNINCSLLLPCPFSSLSCSVGFIRFVLPGVTQCLLDLRPLLVKTRNSFAFAKLQFSDCSLSLSIAVTVSLSLALTSLSLAGALFQSFGLLLVIFCLVSHFFCCFLGSALFSVFGLRQCGSIFV